MAPPKRLPTPFPRKRFGQHFLEPAWVAKVIRAIDPQPTDHFLEIGPGRGALTRPLLERVRRTSWPSKSIAIWRPDCAERTLDLPWSKAIFSRRRTGWPIGSIAAARVAGNLPYNVASPILFKLIELYAAGVPLVDATLMLQREVADRLIARPVVGSTASSASSSSTPRTSTGFCALPPGAFRPPPKVRSALVRVRFRAPRPPGARSSACSRTLVQAVFTRRRKTLANALLAFPLIGSPAAGRGAGASRASTAAGVRRR